MYFFFLNEGWKTRSPKNLSFAVSKSFDLLLMKMYICFVRFARTTTEQRAEDDWNIMENLWAVMVEAVWYPRQADGAAQTPGENYR